MPGVSLDNAGLDRPHPAKALDEVALSVMGVARIEERLKEWVQLSANEAFGCSDD